MKRRILAALLLTMILVSLAACGAKEAPAGSENGSAEETVPTPTPEPLKLLGKEAEGEHVFTVEVKNGTGKDIVFFAVRAEGDTAEPENLLAENDAFAAGETRALWYDGADAFAALAQSQSENEPERTPEFTLVLKFAGEDEAQEVHAFPFGDAKQAELKLEEGLTYLVYTSETTKQTVNTKDAEQSARELAAKAAEDAAAAEAARQQAAAAEAARQQQQQQQQQPAQPTPEPVPDDGGEGDGCIDDGIMY